MDINDNPGQPLMLWRLDDVAERVRRAGLVAELVHGPSYPLLVVRWPSPVLVQVMAGCEHFWWYGEQAIYPIVPVDDVAGAAQHIVDRARAVGGRS